MLLLTGVSVYKHGKQCQDRGDTCTMIIMINIQPHHHRESNVTTTPVLQMVGNGEKILNCQPGISIEQLVDDKFLFDQQSRLSLLPPVPHWTSHCGNILFWPQSRLLSPSIWQPLTHSGSTLSQPSPQLR